MKNLILLLSLSGLLASCAHHRDVRAGADGNHRVMIRTDDKDKGARSAISQANSYCKEEQKRPAFINESQTYTGDMDEENYQLGKRASKAAKVLGGTTWVLGGERESSLGGVIGLGGLVGDAALGDGYTIDMKFKCQ